MTLEGFINLFKLGKNAEAHEVAMENILKGVSFRGTNILILIFAIIIASVGLNVNSAAVIIGAMLISPLMGPIVGVGAGLGVMDLELVKRGLKNLSFAALASVATSTIYFFLSPLDEAHSEILARTSPTIWDVLIAVSGGFAGIIASASKERGNVVPGVAIATALMPPLCTAGFGLAHLNWPFFFGAMYLFIINSVFISIAALFTVRWLRYPAKQMLDERTTRRMKRSTAVIVICTVLPSIYLAYRLVEQNAFKRKCEEFIAQEATIPDNYLVANVVDVKERTIRLTYMGRGVDVIEEARLRERMALHGIGDAHLDVRTGLSLTEIGQADKAMEDNATNLLAERKALMGRIRMVYDSLANVKAGRAQLLAEARAEHPALLFLGVDENAAVEGDSIPTMVMAHFTDGPDSAEYRRLEGWLTIKLAGGPFRLVVSPPVAQPVVRARRKRH
ncbi:MAG: TIGR00341 family protein [Flavobacteriales bacterium]|nr:TIGR00341 family protein [Flavobacteriales bacterium]